MSEPGEAGDPGALHPTTAANPMGAAGIAHVGELHASVVVIGAGWAGCAAAVALAQAGVAVHLVEAGPVAGGRARRVVRDGLPLDNGQHLLLGAYRATRGLVGTLHGTPPWRAEPLAYGPWSARQADGFTLRARALPAPLGLLAGLLLARGLTCGERVATVRWFAALKRSGYRCAPGQTVAALTASLPAAVTRKLWDPLCIAALNTPASAAAAEVFVNVLRDAFDGHARDTEVLWPSVDLSVLVGDATTQFVAMHGGSVTLGARAAIAAVHAETITVATRAAARTAHAVIVAVGPHQLEPVLTPLAADPALAAAVAQRLEQVRGLAYEPITTVYLGYGASIPGPAVGALTRLDDQPGQWLFTRPDILARAAPGAPALKALLSVVISAAGPHSALEPGALALAVDAQLRCGRPGMPPLAWSQVIAEQRATYACTPAALAVRRALAAATPIPHVYFAGDYLDLDYPATLEAAVRSGNAAAQRVVERRARVTRAD